MTMEHRKTEIQSLHNAILEIRDCGEVTFSVQARPTSTSDITTLLDEFVAKFDFIGLSEGWKEIDGRTAKEITSEVIFRDLAHGVEMTTEERASRLAEQFLNNFTLQPRFFTNGIFESGSLSSWYPISGSTFDTGVVCFDDKNIGILWVQDED